MNQETLTIQSKPKLANFSTWQSIYPWLVFALSSSFLFYKYLLQVSPSIMVNELMRTFSLTGAGLGNLVAYYFYAYLSLQLPVGLLLDKFSARKLVAAAIAVCAGGALLFSKATSLGIAELARLLIGIGGAFSAVGTMKLITLWFPPRRFALVSGLMMTIGMLGAIGGEAPLSAMVDYFGWRETLFLGALAGFALALIIWLAVRDKKQSQQNKKISHNDGIGFLSSLNIIIRKKQTWLISLYSGLAFAPITAFAGLWGVPYLMEKYQVDRTTMGALVSFIFIGFAIGSPLAGWLSDRIGKRKPLMAVGTSSSLLLLLSILYLPSLPNSILALLLFAFGFFTGFFFISFATIREINPENASGTSIGFINTFNAICGALSEPLVGKFLDMGWGGLSEHGARLFSISDYQWSLTILPAGLIAALIILAFVNETHCKQQ